MSAPAPAADLTVSAARLHRAAAALVRHGRPADPDHRATIARMAGSDPNGWGVREVEYAARAMEVLRDDLIASGVDPTLLPAPSNPAPTSTAPDHREHVRPTHPAGHRSEPRPTPTLKTATTFPGDPTGAPAPVAGVVHPFDYEGTIDGLRGIPVTDLPGVGSKRGQAFSQAGIESCYDLLMHVPLRYIERVGRTPLSGLTVGETATVLATVVSSKADTLRGGMRLARVEVEDETGRLSVTFFNAPWQANRFKKGDEVVAMGRVDLWENPTTGAAVWQMKNPLMDRVGAATANVIPVYPQSDKAGLTTWMVHQAVGEALARIGDLADPIPAEFIADRSLLGRVEALHAVHTPSAPGLEVPGRNRLAYDELLLMQLGLGMRRNTTRSHPAIKHAPTGALTGALMAALPFNLTGAQTRAIAEITADMVKPEPSNRLLQGDVGSGKTLTVLAAMLVAVEGGNQAALMAPTEILATQHYAEIRDLLADIKHPTGRPLRVAAMTNRVKTKERRANLEDLAAGDCDIVVGTHSLLSDDVVFKSLGLVVVDEQHRFGVAQRATLRDKGPGGARADMVAATATPIPRTAAMTVFGDLDVTILDELPPGRTPRLTEWIDAEVNLTGYDAAPWDTVRSQVAQGRQAFVVCPLVTESETMQAASAEETLAALESGALSGLRLGLVHGKQKAPERAAVMEAFTAGAIDVLVATTVIEVGVSIPNASVIVVLDPSRFGMAQLHQLRGRVGRGKHASTCYLYGTAASGETRRRLEALEQSDDGFALSQIDLDIRGMGTVFGAAQAGLGDLRVASLDTDTALVAAAREDAGRLLSGDPLLARRPGLRAEVMGALGEDGQDWLERG